MIEFLKVNNKRVNDKEDPMSSGFIIASPDSSAEAEESPVKYENFLDVIQGREWVRYFHCISSFGSWYDKWISLSLISLSISDTRSSSIQFIVPESLELHLQPIFISLFRCPSPLNEIFR